MQFADSLVLDAPKRTRDGFLAVRAKAARAGVYDYGATEVGGIERGFKASDTVKVYRPADEVFAADSVASFLAKPVTNDHPAEAVTADNWKQHARGVNMGALRDGDYLAFDLVIMDGALIADIDAGKRELSNGYSCTLDWGAGVTDAGLKYDAIQRNIRGNHIAVVDKGRAGPECQIQKDSIGGKRWSNCDANPLAISGLNEGYKMKITLDGVQVTLTDASEVQAAFDKIKADAVAASESATAALADEKAKVATLTAEKTALEAKVTANDAVDLDKLVADRAALVAKAKSLKPDLVVDGKSADEIRKEIVLAALGDDAKDFDAAQITAAFAVISKDAKADDKKVVPLNPTVRNTDGADAVATIRAARYA
ncbi:MAG: DUF2213 domain-containing protein [Pseudomonadota bacterium]